MKISKIKENARKALTEKWGKGNIISLAYLTFWLIMGMVEGMFDDSSKIANLVSIVTTIIRIPLSFGLTYSFIRLKRGEDVKAFDFLNNGFSNFGRAWKISLRVVLKMLLPIILLCISTIIAEGISTYISIELLSTNEVIFVALARSIVILAIYSWLIVRALRYSLTTYIAFDNPDMTALEVVNESENMMKGNRLKLFLLILSFIGWAILCLFTFLWLIPYIQVSQVCFYENILENKKDNVDEEPIIEK